jgi:hypothetical protein
MANDAVKRNVSFPSAWERLAGWGHGFGPRRRPACLTQHFDHFCYLGQITGLFEALP